MGEEGQERRIDSVSQGDRSLGSSLETIGILFVIYFVSDLLEFPYLFFRK